MLSTVTQRKKSRVRQVKCEICGVVFETSHSQGKYCSNVCKRQGERASWRKYGRKNKQRRHDYHKDYYNKNKEQITARIKAYQASEAGRQAQRNNTITQRTKYPEKYSARHKVRSAVKKGILVKTACVFCENKKVQAHHSDYKKPLEVIWLCGRCHTLFNEKGSVKE